MTLVLVLLLQAETPLFPQEMGKKWTFRESNREIVVTSEKIGEGKIQLITEVGDSGYKTESPGKSSIALKEGDRIAWIVEFEAKEIRFYRNAMGAMFTRHWTIREADQWEAEGVFLSCGFGSRKESYKASTEKVTVPAGTFEAVKIELSYEGRPFQTLWFARGVGLVKWQQGPEWVRELVKMDKP
jgi:hypothetical protein